MKIAHCSWKSSMCRCPLQQKLCFHPFKYLPLNSILVNLILHLTWSRTKRKHMGHQVQSPAGITSYNPFHMSLYNQSAQHIRIPHQLVLPHTMVSEWDHDLHQWAVSLRPGSSHAFLQDPNHLYQNSIVFYSPHATKWSWISSQMMEDAIYKVKEKKASLKVTSDEVATIMYSTSYTLLLSGVRHSYCQVTREIYHHNRVRTSSSPCQLSRIQQAVPLLPQILPSLSCWGTSFKLTTKTKPPPHLFSPRKNATIPWECLFLFPASGNTD